MKTKKRCFLREELSCLDRVDLDPFNLLDELVEEIANAFRHLQARVESDEICNTQTHTHIKKAKRKKKKISNGKSVCSRRFFV